MRPLISRMAAFTLIGAVMLLCIIAFVIVPAPAQTEVQVRIDEIIAVPNSTETQAQGISDTGVIVGTYVDSSRSKAHGFKLANKKFTTIDDPNGSGLQTVCWDINSKGVIVGSYLTPSYLDQAFVYQDGLFTDIGPAGSVSSQAFAINNNGDIVGYYNDSSGLTHGFLWDGTTYTTLDVPGGTSTFATGINDNGKIVLEYYESGGNRVSSIYNGSTYKPIIVRDSIDTLAFQIDNHADVAAQWTDTNGHNHAGLRYGGIYYSFGGRQGAITATGINNHRQIVGSLTSGEESLNGFRATY
jgi:probable HAF family extracellular repeat protein